MRYLMIRTEDLTKYFGQRLAVKDLSLEVEPGEVFGLLGLKDAGKTTTIRLLLDFIRASEGRALVMGLDSHRNSLAVRRRVGYLPAENPIYEHFSGERFLRYLARLRGQADWAYTQELAGRLGVDLSRPIRALDRSDRRKIGLVQAFMHRPELVILDEPGQDLDPQSHQALHDLLTETRSDGRSVMLASESLQMMERVCDRVGVLHCGQMVAVERGVHLRARALRQVEMRFAAPISADAFAGLPNLENLRLHDNLLSCTVRGDPDALIKTASRYRVTDFISRSPSLEEVVHSYYGAASVAA
jgi:ABC-2 type transport system ATP-binding protein